METDPTGVRDGFYTAERQETDVFKSFLCVRLTDIYRVLRYDIVDHHMAISMRDRPTFAIQFRLTSLCVMKVDNI